MLGRRTTTSAYDPESSFKPGIDFYDDGAGHIGQAKALQQYAAAQRQGGHVTDRREQPPLRRHRPDLRHRLAHVTVVVEEPAAATTPCACCSASNIATQTANIKTAILNVRTAMSCRVRRLVVLDLGQHLLNPIPRGSGFRYPETGYTVTSAAGVWNSDADWANDTVVPSINGSVKNAAAASGLSNVKVLDMQTLMDGHRLCEKTVSLLEEKGLTSWTQVGAVDTSEWFQQIRTATAIFHRTSCGRTRTRTTGASSRCAAAHRACNGGTARAGKCVSTGGLSSAASQTWR